MGSLNRLGAGAMATRIGTLAAPSSSYYRGPSFCNLHTTLITCIQFIFARQFDTELNFCYLDIDIPRFPPRDLRKMGCNLEQRPPMFGAL